MNQRRKRRQAEAEARQSLRATRTPTQQLARLDKLLGPGIGARKERARLANAVIAKRGQT
jgi:hypothetical protein